MKKIEKRTWKFVNCDDIDNLQKKENRKFLFLNFWFVSKKQIEKNDFFGKRNTKKYWFSKENQNLEVN
jgi:hypothetical protein